MKPMTAERIGSALGRMVSIWLLLLGGAGVVLSLGLAAGLFWRAARWVNGW